MVDALGNWTFRVTDSLPEFGTANAQNELTDIDSATLAYDANGNMTVDELGRSLTYDAWNRLTVVVDAYSIPLAAYQYDALGQRVLCYTDDGTVAELRDLFYSDLWQVLEERVRPVTGGVSSQADVQNVWSPVYVDALIERDRDADASATTGVGGLEERVYALQDANWNTTALVAASVTGVTAGTVLNRFIYSAYGEAEVFDAAWSSVSTPSVPWTQLFQGLSMTALTGLAYVRHRDYSPRLGRFIQRDPLGFEAGDNNWYRFVGNGPTGKVDPTGLKTVCGFTVWLYTGLGWCVDETIYTAALESGGIAAGQIAAGTYGASIGGSVAVAPNPIVPMGCNATVSFDGHVGLSQYWTLTGGFGGTVGAGVNVGNNVSISVNFVTTDAPDVQALSGWGNNISPFLPPIIPIGGSYLYGDNGSYEGYALGRTFGWGIGVGYTRTYSWYYPIGSLPLKSSSQTDFRRNR
jgi:RHS repeat-associated protein